MPKSMSIYIANGTIANAVLFLRSISLFCLQGKVNNEIQRYS